MMCVVDLAEYSRIAAIEDAHWWYHNTRHLVGDMLRPWLRSDLLGLDGGAVLAETVPGWGSTAPLWASTSLPKHCASCGRDVRPVPFRRALLRSTRGSFVRHRDCHHRADFGSQRCGRRPRDVPSTASGRSDRVVRTGIRAIAPRPRRDRAQHSPVPARRPRSTRDRGGMRVHRSTYAYSFLAPAAAALPVADRYGRRSSAATRSDVQRRGLDWLFSPCAAAERRWLRRYRVPFGTSVALVTTRDDD